MGIRKTPMKIEQPPAAAASRIDRERAAFSGDSTPASPRKRRPEICGKSTKARISSVGAVFGIFLGASFPATAADPTASFQVKTLQPVVLGPTADATSTPLAAIWDDKLGEIRARLAGKSPAFLSASFDDGDATIIISVSVSDPTCENLSGALGRPTTGGDCPMRVARLRGGVVSILAGNDHFVVPIPIDASGASAPPSPNNSVVATFDPASHSLEISERIDGESADAANPNPILLKY
jgi:hypothetical protein